MTLNNKKSQSWLLDNLNKDSVKTLGDYIAQKQQLLNAPVVQKETLLSVSQKQVKSNS